MQKSASERDQGATAHVHEGCLHSSKPLCESSAALRERMCMSGERWQLRGFPTSKVASEGGRWL
eukprot:12883714-Alexandrium_andersonii.AAC.1